MYKRLTWHGGTDTDHVTNHDSELNKITHLGGITLPSCGSVYTSKGGMFEGLLNVYYTISKELLTLSTKTKSDMFNIN